MPGEATHRTLRAFKDEGVAHAVAIIRDSIEEDEQRARRKDYEQYLSRMQFLSSLSQFAYEQFDYTPYLERKLFVSPETPDFSYMVPEAEKRTREQHKPHMKAVGGVMALAIFVDLFILGTPAAILSILSVLVAGFMIYQQTQDQSRAIAVAVSAAEAEVGRMIAEFQEGVEKDEVVFNYDENERIAALQKVLEGKPDAVLDACQKTAATKELPFVLRGRIELSGPNALISFKMPDDEFVPKAEWREDHPGRYSITERTVTNLNQLYAEAVAAAMLQVILSIFEQVPTIASVAVNGFKQVEERQICLMGVAVSREELQAVTAGQSGLKIVEELGAVRLQTSCSLATVEPVIPEWMASTVEREIHKGGIHCSVKVR